MPTKPKIRIIILHEYNSRRTHRNWGREGKSRCVYLLFVFHIHVRSKKTHTHQKNEIREKGTKTMAKKVFLDPADAKHTAVCVPALSPYTVARCPFLKKVFFSNLFRCKQQTKPLVGNPPPTQLCSKTFENLEAASRPLTWHTVRSMVVGIQRCYCFWPFWLFCAPYLLF